jgi:hypothetical protein
VSKDVSFEKLDFNLFIAGELEIVCSSKISRQEKQGRLNLFKKKLMYLNSSYEFVVTKSLNASKLREIEFCLDMVKNLCIGQSQYS